MLFSYGGSCAKIDSDITFPPNIQGSHHEADTLLAFHAKMSEGNLVVRASDTDVMIIMLGMINKHKEQNIPVQYGNITMDVGTGNSQRFIDINKIHDQLENHSAGLSGALFALHAFSGSDYNASFYRKGKVLPLKLLLQNDTLSAGWIKSFRQMATQSFCREEDVESFVCAMYGMKDCKNTNLARKMKIVQQAKPNSKLPDQIKKIDCGLLPPCKKVLQNKIKRSQYVAITWSNADQPNPTEGMNPEEYGWYKVGNSFLPKWYEGSPLPAAEDLHVNDRNESSDEEDDECTLESETQWTDSSDDDYD